MQPSPYWDDALTDHAGIAETNIDENLKDLYKIPGYTSEYGERMSGKSKGTGLIYK